MAFFGTVARLVFDLLPSAILFYLPILLLIVVVLVMRRRAVERHLLGKCRNSFWREVGGDAISGIGAGFVSSFLLIFLGITINTEGFIYVLLAAFLLMLVDLRYLCLAYAGGLLSLFSLLTGLPKLHIPGLLALVAILHFTESALIMVGGDQRALPVYFGRPGGTVGGYLLQRVWPVPLLVLGMIALTGQEAVTYVNSPDWWPLIPMGAASPALVYTAMPVPATLGYGDMALTSTPRTKAVRTAILLSLYSIVLLALAVASSRLRLFAWVAAAFAPCGHELVLYTARRIELRGKPAFTMGADGIPVLEVLPGSRAALSGLASGETIVRINGLPVRTKADLLARLGESDLLTAVETVDGRGRPHKYEFRGDARNLGLVTAPDPGDPPQVRVGPWRLRPGRRESI